MADYLTDVGPVNTADTRIRVGAGGSIGGFSGTALTWTNGGTLDIWGSIWAGAGGTGIAKSGSDGFVTIFAGGSVAGVAAMTGTFGSINNLGTISGAVTSTTTADFSMENYGSIANFYGGALRLTASPTSAIFNSGTITGFGADPTRSVVSYASGANTLLNNGTIALNPSTVGRAATYVIGADNAAASIAVTNNGLIAGVTNAIKGGNGTDSVVNNGHISGAIALGGGNDTFDTTYGVVAGTVDLGDGDDRGIGGALVDRINGGAGADMLTGNGGDDVLDGGADNDTLDGGTGQDRMIGGTGNDIFYVDSARDVVIEATNGGTDTINTTVSYTLRAGQEVEMLRADPAGELTGLTLTGNDFAQTIIGDAGANRILSGGGADVMRGLGGNDTYVLFDANETVVEDANAGYDTIVTPGGFGPLPANVEELRLADPKGTDEASLAGNALDNRIVGNAGDNTIDGRAGADTMVGGAGNDLYFVDNAGDVVSDTSGTDTVYARISYILPSSIEDLLLLDGAVSGTGNTGANAITGNDADNLLNGRGGIDTLTGGDGADTFAFDAALRTENVASITDFTSGTDHIALDDRIFRKIGGPGALSGDFFTTGAATTADHHILYDTTTGVLSYDRDGSGTAFDAVAFAGVTVGTVLTAADIIVF